MLRFIFLFTIITCSYSQTVIGEGMVGQQLLDYVVDNYKTSTTLGYNNARDILYGTIDIGEDNELSCVYSGFTITLDITQDPSTNAYNQGVNCEHSWPQSMGADEEPQKSDLHHLYPCKANVNSSRGNHPYAEIEDEITDTWYRNDYSQESIPLEFIEEYAEKLNGGEPVFEPREDHKGNASRAMFYFFAMYQDDADTNFWSFQKHTLLDWHYLDPVNEMELERTWLIASYQEDQPNPFILDSSLARRIWFVENNGGANPPDTFSLIMPYNHMEILSLLPNFLWHSSEDNDWLDTVRYTVMLDGPDPGIVVYEAGTDTSFSMIESLQDNSQYFWQVIAQDLSGHQTVNQNGYQTFFINTNNEPPTMPILVAPIHGSIQSNLTPSLYWTESLDPDPMDQITYVLYLKEHGSIEWQSIYLDTNSYSPVINLMDNASYSWYVHSSDLYGGEVWTDSINFFTDVFPEPPGAFFTVSPQDQALNIDSEIQFIWRSSIDPDPLEIIQYQLVYVNNLEDWDDTLNYNYSELIEDTVITLNLEDNGQYYWGVIARDTDGFKIVSNDGNPNELMIGALTTKQDNIPSVFSLSQNFPNPFNPATNITYDIPRIEHVIITIHDIVGRHITTLVDENKNTGSYSIIWNGRNNIGKDVPAGMYIYTIKAGSFSNSKKLVLLK
ncbi:MAG: hypothetical protein CMG55_09785 [Candidatus Marinimicrobia bacterium]|nr:hypothetical protein [Candidatus Neomarinimicrobiota bacterium]